MSKESLTFHIEQNDYFGTLATILDLLHQDLRKQGHGRHADTLVRLRDDLVYLQSSYTIKTGTARDEERGGDQVVARGQIVVPIG